MRPVLRQKAKEALKDYPLTQGRIFVGQVHPLDLDQLPAISIRTGEHQSEVIAMNKGGGYILNHRISFEFRTYLAGRDDYLSKQDEIADEIQKRLTMFDEFTDLFNHFYPTSFEIEEDLANSTFISCGILTCEGSTTTTSHNPTQKI